MATVTMNPQNGTLMVTLTAAERSTATPEILSALESYLTLWLQERAKDVFVERFAKLSPEDQALVMAKFSGV